MVAFMDYKTESVCVTDAFFNPRNDFNLANRYNNDARTINRKRDITADKLEIAKDVTLHSLELLKVYEKDLDDDCEKLAEEVINVFIRVCLEMTLL